GPMRADEVAGIGAKVAAALHDVHRQGVIHLDLKPSNVMLRESGEAALIDFGFSRHLELPDLLAEEIPGPIGTGAYIAPEQLLGNRNDPRSDIFALGVILYFFATGERPFGEPKGVREWRRRLYHDPPPPRALRPDCPPWLQEIILRCLEIDPGQRHARPRSSHSICSTRSRSWLRHAASAPRAADRCAQSHAGSAASGCRPRSGKALADSSTSRPSSW